MSQVIFLDSKRRKGLPKQTATIGSDMSTGISSFGAWMLGVGAIIGSMAWLIHGPMIARSGPMAAVIAWIIAGVMSLPTAFILMELSSMFPTAGGPYVYKYYALKRLVPGSGELFGFLTGWLFWIAIIVGNACMANGMVNLLCNSMFGTLSVSPIWFGPAVIVALFGSTTLLNFRSIKEVSALNTALTLLKFGMVASFAWIVFNSGHCAFGNLAQIANFSGGSNLVANISSVLMLALAGFGFLEAVGCTSSETANAQKSVPRAVLLTLFSVTAIYVGMCVCVAVAQPFALSADKSTIVIAGTSLAASCPSIAGVLAGPTCGGFFTGLVVASIFACTFTAIMGMARISYSMAETRLFPRQFASLHPVTRVPVYGLQTQFWIVTGVAVAANVCARTGVFPDAYTFLGEVFGFMYAFVVMLYGVCVVSLRYTDPSIERPFRIGGAKAGNIPVWLAAICTAGTWGYAAFGCVHWSIQLCGLVVLLMGVPVYFYYRNTRADLVYSDPEVSSKI